MAHLMAVMTRTARRSAAAQRPHPHRDETWPLSRSNTCELAERALRTALLSVSSAEAAPGSLEGLGELLASARLLFRRRATVTALGAETREGHSRRFQ